MLRFILLISCIFSLEASLALDEAKGPLASLITVMDQPEVGFQENDVDHLFKRARADLTESEDHFSLDKALDLYHVNDFESASIVPLQIGARDLAFPFVNSLGLWLTIAGGILINLFFVIGGDFANTGWLALAPFSKLEFNPNVGVDYLIWSLQLSGLGSLLAGINFLVTIIKKRAPGMTLMKMPLFTWISNSFIFSFIFLIALSLIAGRNEQKRVPYTSLDIRIVRLLLRVLIENFFAAHRRCNGLPKVPSTQQNPVAF